jgi:hypothetical protein
MKSMILPFAVWLGVLQVVPAPPTTFTLQSVGALLGVAGSLAGLTVLVYRLGVWRQEMHHARDVVGTQVANLRDQCAASFGRIDRRLTAIERRLHRVERERAA